MMGDSSDNIPGVAGIGEKTAMDLIRRFGTLERVYQNWILRESGLRVRKKLEEGRESALMSYKLAKIDQKAPLSFEPGQNMLSPPDNARFILSFSGGIQQAYREVFTQSAGRQGSRRFLV
jgi:DNA polymerase-1